MKKLFSPAVFLSCLLVAITSNAQDAEMPPGQVIVVTACLINDGYTVSDVMTAARAIDYSADDSPNFVFYRQPISGNNVPSNLLMRVNYFNDLEHWAGRNFGEPSTARRLLNRMLSCNTTNRTMSKNYNIGPGGQPYEGGTAPSGLVATAACNLKPGVTLQQVYNQLLAFNQPYRDAGDTTLFQLSHRFMGSTANVDMGSRFLLRFTGTTPEGLATRIDMGDKLVGTPPDFGGENCRDFVLWTSHVAHWGGVGN